MLVLLQRLKKESRFASCRRRISVHLDATTPNSPSRVQTRIVPHATRHGFHVTSTSSSDSVIRTHPRRSLRRRRRRRRRRVVDTSSSLSSFVGTSSSDSSDDAEAPDVAFASTSKVSDSLPSSLSSSSSSPSSSSSSSSHHLSYASRLHRPPANVVAVLFSVLKRRQTFPPFSRTSVRLLNIANFHRWS